ncbi:MAG TPA: DNA-binding protein [Gammaproteobacteria bacterium]|nr:DNA-binding protein [Gammaproteobacteria bacterium]
MARHGITYEDVISAISALKGQDKNITIENVRHFLGTGSAGTINQHLRRFRQAQNKTSKIVLRGPMPEFLIEMIKGLWENVLSQSTEQFVPIELNYQQEIAELKTELEKYRQNNRRWQQLFNQWQQEKMALTHDKRALEQALEHYQRLSLLAES